MTATAILRLQKVGFTQDQVEALADYLDSQAATKADLAAAEGRLEVKLSELRGELTLIKWMLGFNLALSAAVLVKMLAP